MRIGVVTDSTCDLQRDFFRDNHITILPITIRLGDEYLVDEHDPGQTLDFYQGGLWDRAHDAESIPYTKEQIAQTFLERLVLDFDYVFCVTVMGARSPICDNATKASFAILSRYRDIRKEAGVEGNFTLRVIDSQNLFAGQGVIVAETMRMINNGVHVTQIREHVTNLRAHVYTYAVADDLYYIRKRGRQKGDKSVGLLQYMVGSTLNIKPVLRCYRNKTAPVHKGRGFEPTVEKVFELTTKQIERGLLASTVVISYGGDPEKVMEMPGYRELEQAAKAHDIDLHLTYLSITGGINIGAGALTVGFAAEEHEFG